jgi:hypothetical protein
MEPLTELAKLRDASLECVYRSRESVQVVFATIDLGYDEGGQSRRIDGNQLCFQVLTLGA